MQTNNQTNTLQASAIFTNPSTALVNPQVRHTNAIDGLSIFTLLAMTYALFKFRWPIIKYFNRVFS